LPGRLCSIRPACITLGSETIGVLHRRGVSPAPNPQPGGPVSCSLSGPCPSACLARVALPGA
jgi:hypothetical protein